MSGHLFSFLIHLYDKYGVSLASDLIKRKILYLRFGLFSHKLKNTASYSFRIIDSRRKDFFYYGDINDDVLHILEGKRKVLFYDDVTLQKKDIKFDWEKKRLHHLCPVALLYYDTKDKKLLEYLYSEIYNFSKLDFCKNSNAMEVSISLINLIVAVQIAGEADLFVMESVNQVIKKGFLFILSNLEKGIRYSNNHYFFDLIGILWISEVVEKNKTIIAINKLAKKELEKLLQQIISDDGSLYEGSSYYHRYVLESLLEYMYYRDENKTTFLLEFANKMLNFLYGISNSGTIIGIGDNDSGRLLPIGNYFVYSSKNIDIIEYFSEKLSLQKNNFNEIIRFDNFGLYLIGNSNIRVMMRCDCIPNKMKNKVIGSHYHNDQLSIQVVAFNKDLFIDPGTYLYIEDRLCRLESRMTKNHNTVFIPDIEQNLISNDWRYIERKAVGKLLDISSSVIDATVEYSSIIHHRLVKLKENCIVIEDTVHGYKFQAGFLLSPEFDIIRKSDSSALITGNIYSVILSTNGNIVIEDAFYSPEYGLKIKTKRIMVFSAGDTLIVRLEMIS